MSSNLLLRSLLTWFLFVPVAVMNGILREKLYKPFVGELTAHQISTLIAIIAYLIVCHAMLREEISKDVNDKILFIIGLMWVGMTIFFEFGFGHYIDGQSWAKLVADYNIFNGRVWGVLLLMILFSPMIIKSLRNYR